MSHADGQTTVARLGRAWDRLRQEIVIEPVRARRVGRVTGLCTLVAVLSMALQVPEAAISAYMVFFVTKNDAVSTTITGAGVAVAATIGIAVSLLFYALVMDEPALRLALMVVMTFAGMFFSRVSSVGPIGFALAFITTLALTAADVVPVPELVVRGLLWLWVVVAYPTALVVLANLALGERPNALLFRRIALALRKIGTRVTGQSAVSIELVRDDLAELGKDLVETRSADLSARRALVAQVDQLAMLVGQTEGRLEPEAAHAIAGVCDAMAMAVEGAVALPGTQASEAHHSGSTCSALWAAVVRVEQGLQDLNPRARRPKAKARLLVADAFSNPEHRRFALKTTLACMTAYLVYTGLHWPGIRTALITCFFVAQSSQGEIMHKLRMRILGAAIGAAMGLASIIWIIPQLDSVGGLAMLVAAGTLPAAWLASGHSRFRYAGWQMAFAFYLCVLHGFGPSTDMVVARDRLIGILLGNLVMWAVFTHLWPVHHRTTLFRGLANAVDALAAWGAADQSQRFHLAVVFQSCVSACRDERHLLRYERAAGEVADADRALASVESLWLPVTTSVDEENAPWSTTLADLAERLRAAAHAPYRAPSIEPLFTTQRLAQ